MSKRVLTPEQREAKRIRDRKYRAAKKAAKLAEQTKKTATKKVATKKPAGKKNEVKKPVAKCKKGHGTCKCKKCDASDHIGEIEINLRTSWELSEEVHNKVAGVLAAAKALIEEILEGEA